MGYNPALLPWCQQYHEAIVHCVQISYGCFFKFRCEHPCVCKEWKDRNCGGLTGDPNAKCEAASFLERTDENQSMTSVMTQRGQVQNEKELTQSLDNALIGKCSNE